MRLLSIAALLFAAAWLAFSDGAWLDQRPVECVLFLGHSQTYYNNMPAMVAKMADSANSPVRFDVTMHAFPNATLEDHWQNRKTRQLLSEGGWHRLVVHSEGGLSMQDSTSSMQVHGLKLLAATRTADLPMLVIDHQATEAFHQRHYSVTRSEHSQIEQENVRQLAIAGSAEVIDVARVWDRVLAPGLPFSLYKDGNHPSLEGSYLIALVIYASLSRSGVDDVTYVPWRMSNHDAALLRSRVQSALNGS